MPSEFDFKLRLPGDREETYSYFNTLRKNSQGKPVLVESQEQVEGLEEPVVIQAYDEYGQAVFQPFGPFNEIVIKGRDSSGWQCQVKDRKDGLPVIIEKTFRHGIDLSRVFASEELKEGIQDLQGSKKEVHIEYDNNGRPVNISQYSVVDAKTPLNPDKPLLSLDFERKYCYDEKGRLKAAAILSPTEDGNDRLLDYAEFYGYESISPTHVRITKCVYEPLYWKDLKKGACIRQAYITDINPDNHKILAHVYYHYDTRCIPSVTAFGNTMHADYQRAKRYPDFHQLEKVTPPSLAPWQHDNSYWQKTYPNWESLPVNLTVPTYITREGFEKYIRGLPLTEIGTRTDEKKKVQVLFLEEYLDKINKSSEEESIETINDILHGRLAVHSASLFPARLSEKWPEAQSMNIPQRLAFLAVFLPAIIADVYNMPKTSDTYRGYILDDCKKLKIIKQSRLKFLGDFMRKHANDMNDEIKATLGVLQFLENLPDIVIQAPQRFRDLLEDVK